MREVEPEFVGVPSLLVKPNLQSCLPKSEVWEVNVLFTLVFVLVQIQAAHHVGITYRKSSNYCVKAFCFGKAKSRLKSGVFLSQISDTNGVIG